MAVERKRRTRSSKVEEIQALRNRLEEAEETLRAIRSGEVDAIVVSGDRGEQIYTLAGAEKSYRIILQTMSEGAFTVNRAGIILYSNQRFADMLKMPLEKIIGSSLFFLIAPEDLTGFTDFFQGLVSENAHREMGLRVADGSILPVNFSASLLTGDTVESIIVVVTDLTERKHAEEQLRQANEELEQKVVERTAELTNKTEKLEVLAEELEASNEEMKVNNEDLLRVTNSLRESELREHERATELATLLDAVPMPVFIVHDPEARHVTGNLAADKLLRHPRGSEVSLSAPLDVRPTHFKAIKDGRELKPGELPAQRAACGEHVKDFEFSLVFFDGSIRHVVGYGTPLLNEKGKPRGAVHVLVDVTERKLTEEALQKTQDRFRSVLDNSQDVVYRLNLQTGQYEYISPSAEEVVGYSCDELLALPPEASLAMIHPDDLPVMKAALARAEETGRAEAEYRQQTKNGDYRWMSNRMSLTRDRAGKPLYRDGNIRDVTLRKQAEEAVQASLHQKETLLKEIHHRIKNNLAMVQALLSLQAGHIDPQNAAQSLKEAQNRVKSIALVHEKLYRSADVSRMNFADYLKSLSDGLMKSFQARDRAIRLQIDAQDLFLDIDTALPCSLVVNELLTNALRHAFPQGRSGNIHLALKQDNGDVTLEVRDDGVGLPMGFDPAKSDTLGLKLITSLAGQLHGEVDFRVEEGTCARLKFPVKPQPELI